MSELLVNFCHRFCLNLNSIHMSIVGIFLRNTLNEHKSNHSFIQCFQNFFDRNPQKHYN
jgi:hypothetical protein